VKQDGRLGRCSRDHRQHPAGPLGRGTGAHCVSSHRRRRPRGALDLRRATAPSPAVQVRSPIRTSRARRCARVPACAVVLGPRLGLRRPRPAGVLPDRRSRRALHRRRGAGDPGPERGAGLDDRALPQPGWRESWSRTCAGPTGRAGQGGEGVHPDHGRGRHRGCAGPASGAGHAERQLAERRVGNRPATHRCRSGCSVQPRPRRPTTGNATNRMCGPGAARPVVACGSSERQMITNQPSGRDDQQEQWSRLGSRTPDLRIYEADAPPPYRSTCTRGAPDSTGSTGRPRRTELRIPRRIRSSTAPVVYIQAKPNCAAVRSVVGRQGCTVRTCRAEESDLESGCSALVEHKASASPSGSTGAGPV
jgi:hypothetical protein